MIKMVFVFAMFFCLVGGISHIMYHMPKEMMYNWIKKLLVVLGVVVVTSGILFVIVQLF